MASGEVSAASRPDYGNWVAARLIYGPVVVGLVLIGLALLVLLLGPAWLSGILVALALIALLVAGYFAYARRLLSVAGGDVQARVQGLVLERLPWDGAGSAIDIGCGNAPLTIRLARAFPQAHVTGIDYWGASWEYSKNVCEVNARIEGVGGRVDFVKASASALPFADATFDAAVSNLCFHEVRDTRDKRAVVEEALRVVKPGGAFAFQDLFLVKSVYGNVDDLLAAVRSWGVERVEFADTSRSDFIPGAMRLPFMTGRISVLYGKR